ncbi:acetolactate synthase small subunit [Candidatus Poribacteria bacterium]|nr:acetolactate synthase small subunit [Candidatus Poribacteria bacterium]
MNGDRHIITVLVQNQFGVLARVAGLFSGKGFNIDSLCVAETPDPQFSRMTLVTHGDERVIDQTVKQLNKLVDVIRVNDLTEEPHVERELVLIKVAAEGLVRSEILQVAEIFRARIVDIAPKSLTIETTGDEGKITALINMLRPYGLIEVARTGKIALGRGMRGASEAGGARLGGDEGLKEGV